MKLINVLVICSNPNGLDFNFPQNKELIQKMSSEEVSSYESKKNTNDQRNHAVLRQNTARQQLHMTLRGRPTLDKQITPPPEPRFEDIKYDFIDQNSNDKKYQEEIFNVGEKTYDIIWFAGCNVLVWLFDLKNVSSIIQQTKYILRPNGKIIFTESPNYVKVYKENQYNKYLTLPIEKLGTHSNKFYNEDISSVLKEWNKQFLLNSSPTENPEYQYYTILDTK